MQIELLYDRRTLKIQLPENATVLATTYADPSAEAWDIVRNAIDFPVASAPLESLLKARRHGDVVIVVSDISRPIPYSLFLPQVIERILSAHVPASEIVILIATGMHRPSTTAEQLEILGTEIVNRFRVEDHIAEAGDLIELAGKSWAGNVIKLNRRFVEAGCRIVTGLVEPHFMAGFSGGRKAVCPGLASPETVEQFHGYEFLSNENAANGILENNPCHLEALSVAQTVGVDFCLNVVLNDHRQVIHATAGDVNAAHRAACDLVRECACPPIRNQFDVLLTNSAGYPLDTTFYQCVKGLVAALPAVKRGGHIVSVGGCREGIGSDSYTNLMLKYSGDYEQFLKDIRESGAVQKDQWQYQMHARVLEKIGRENIHFFTNGIAQAELDQLSVNGVSTENVQQAVQEKINDFILQGKTIAVCPEGPYCAPVVDN